MSGLPPARRDVSGPPRRTTYPARPEVVVKGAEGVEAAATPPVPPFRRVLLAVDFADRRAPLRGLAPTLARLLAGEAVLCHVVMRSTSVAGNENDGSPANPEETEMVRELRAAAVSTFGERGRDLPIRILHGDPGQRICEYAEFLDCHLILLGPRPKATIAKRLLGSVSRYVIANTRRSVLVLGE